jgi:hypothetical protein
MPTLEPRNPHTAPRLTQAPASLPPLLRQPTGLVFRSRAETGPAPGEGVGPKCDRVYTLSRGQPLPGGLPNRWRRLLGQSASAAGVHANLCRARAYRTSLCGDPPRTMVGRTADPVTTTQAQQTSAGASADRACFRAGRLRAGDAALDIRCPQPARGANSRALTERQLAPAPQTTFPKRVGSMVVVLALRHPLGPPKSTAIRQRVCFLRRIGELNGRNGASAGRKGVTRAWSREGRAGSG